MNIGDIIIMSNRNTGYFSWETFAYAGMKGIVENIWEDGSFCINCKTNILICPMKNSYKTNIDGYWIWLNGKEVFHKRIDIIPATNPKKRFQWFIPKKYVQWFGN
jgi:hypothetical protein